MADELKINVTAPGAKAAQADLQGVAQAEKAVTGAASAGTPAIEKKAKATGLAATASEELQMRDRTLLAELKALGPEAGVAADIINVLMNKTTAAAVAFGLAGAAIGVASMAIQAYNKGKDEEARISQETLAILEKERQAYLKLAEAQAKATKSPTGGALTEKRTREAAEAGRTYGFGREGAEWMAVEMARHPGRDREVIAQRAARDFGSKGDVDLAAAQAAEIAEMLASMSPAAKRAGTLAAVERRERARMAAAGESVGAETGGMVKWIKEQANAAAVGGSQKAQDSLTRFLEVYPEAADAVSGLDRNARAVVQVFIQNHQQGGTQFVVQDGNNPAGAKRGAQAP